MFQLLLSALVFELLESTETEMWSAALPEAGLTVSGLTPFLSLLAAKMKADWREVMFQRSKKRTFLAEMLPVGW